MDGLGKQLRSSDKKVSERAKVAEPILKILQDALAEGKPARQIEMTKEQNEAIRDLHLITLKPQIYCCNVDENGLENNHYVDSVKKFADITKSDVIVICGKLESEIAELETYEEKQEFLESVGLKESGLNKLIRAGYHSLNLETFFTAGEKECRSWTFKKGSLAPQAAGVIHTDFERGFIRAEVYHYTDLFEYKSEAGIKDAGKLRVEGKEYMVKDGDIMHFRFNV